VIALLHHRVKRSGGLGIVRRETFDVAHLARHISDRGIQHDVTQRDGTIVHAAAEVDGVSLLDAIDLLDLDEIGADIADSPNADERNSHDQGAGG